MSFIAFPSRSAAVCPAFTAARIMRLFCDPVPAGLRCRGRRGLSLGNLRQPKASTHCDLTLVSSVTACVYVVSSVNGWRYSMKTVLSTLLGLMLLTSLVGLSYATPTVKPAQSTSATQTIAIMRITVCMTAETEDVTHTTPVIQAG